MEIEERAPRAHLVEVEGRDRGRIGSRRTGSSSSPLTPPPRSSSVTSRSSFVAPERQMSHIDERAIIVESSSFWSLLSRCAMHLRSSASAFLTSS